MEEMTSIARTADGSGATATSQIQDSLYSFPYHYIPHIEENGRAWRARFLSWGLEYLCWTKHVEDLVLSHSPDSLLDVGCGDGRFIGEMRTKVRRVCGVDLSRQAINLARALNPDLDYRCASASEVDEEFDVVTAIEVMEHVPRAAMDEFVASLCDRARVGGRVILSVPTTVLPLNRKHFRHYDRKTLLEAVDAGAAGRLELERLDYVLRSSWLYRTYKRATHNRLWKLEVPSLNRLAWRHVWGTLRHADETTGQHLVAAFVRVR